MNIKIRLGDLLLKEGIITEEELNKALEKQQEYKNKAFTKNLVKC